MRSLTIFFLILFCFDHSYAESNSHCYSVADDYRNSDAALRSAYSHIVQGMLEKGSYSQFFIQGKYKIINFKHNGRYHDVSYQHFHPAFYLIKLPDRRSEYGSRQVCYGYGIKAKKFSEKELELFDKAVTSHYLNLVRAIPNGKKYIYYSSFLTKAYLETTWSFLRR